jgi:hypothetical protein
MKISNRSEQPLSPRTSEADRQRTTSIWLFLGVALCPLLFSFWGGFAMGDTSKSESGNYREKFEKTDARVKELEMAISKQNALYLKVDSVFSKNKKDLDMLKVGRAAISGDPSGGMFQTQKMAEISQVNSLNTYLSELKDLFVNPKSLTKTTDEAMFKQMTALYLAQRLELEHDWKTLEDAQAKNMGMDIAAQKDQLDAQIGQLSSKQGEIQVQTLQGQIKSLEASLAACKETSVGKATDSQAIKSSHKQDAQAIVAEIIAIRTSMIDISDNTFRRDSKRIETAKQKIEVNLKTIENAASNIK